MRPPEVHPFQELHEPEGYADIPSIVNFAETAKVERKFGARSKGLASHKGGIIGILCDEAAAMQVARHSVGQPFTPIRLMIDGVGAFP